MTPTAQIAAIRQRAEQATPGPWRWAYQVPFLMGPAAEAVTVFLPDQMRELHRIRPPARVRADPVVLVARGD